MNSKIWWQSKTVQLALVVVGGAVVDGLQAGFGWRQIVVAAVGAAFGVLRSVTTQPVAFKK